MTKSRREFFGESARAVAGVAVLGPRSLGSAGVSRPQLAPRRGRSSRALDILILGGTSFLGPHQIAYAMSRGHSVTTFTRGRTQPTIHARLFDDVEGLVGDRENDLSALRGRRWDAVIDNSGRRVAWTRSSAELLQDSVDLYVYTSSTGVYYPYLGSSIREDTELVLAVPEGVDEQRSIAYEYGVMKANAEREAVRIFGEDRTLVARPTYMMGPGDGTDRFTYWPVRLSRGGEVMVPGRNDDPVQYIDARDVAEWMIRRIESGTTGTFNLAGPASSTGMHQFVYGVQASFSAAASFVSIPDYEFLTEQGVRYVVPWIMPTGDNVGSARVSNELAIATGLTFRPLAESVRDIHQWWHSDAVVPERRLRMVEGSRSLMAREPDIVAAWRARG